ncbi:adenine nucleotide alpha hydrolase [Aquabacter sp. L1I39]|uniref:adenine nucleotide alpha hydrolase n=1 Tax=Aquabacter sp. L1I39 TaxID=2820278 RepID=UPI001ADB3D37|nr:adenine nucleotide alpha hydrolase [Aquabacter sp. L1I39]QTL05012.1 adenine nucleotide alpha hydrolase [Aquabacter sp. L1I39]
MTAPDDLPRLLALLDTLPPLAVAVSGGVDSMTLATLVHRHAATPPLIIHAVSPAVPGQARGLITAHATAEGWNLHLLNAGEQDDPRYRANPFDRCYFCKANLYGAIAAVTERTIASGTNLDDLGEHRPGLNAAREHGVVHPFVTAGIGKPGIRALARHLGLTAFAELPAQPCLASRVETGIAIDPRDLAFIDRTEGEVRRLLGAHQTVRVRLRRDGVHLELRPAPAPDAMADLTALMETACHAEGRTFAGLGAYRVGSGFVRSAAE